MGQSNILHLDPICTLFGQKITEDLFRFELTASRGIMWIIIWNSDSVLLLPETFPGSRSLILMNYETLERAVLILWNGQRLLKSMELETLCQKKNFLSAYDYTWLMSSGVVKGCVRFMSIASEKSVNFPPLYRSWVLVVFIPYFRSL